MIVNYDRKTFIVQAKWAKALYEWQDYWMDLFSLEYQADIAIADFGLTLYSTLEIGENGRIQRPVSKNLLRS